MWYAFFFKVSWHGWDLNATKCPPPFNELQDVGGGYPSLEWNMLGKEIFSMNRFWISNEHSQSSSPWLRILKKWCASMNFWSMIKHSLMLNMLELKYLVKNRGCLNQNPIQNQHPKILHNHYVLVMKIMSTTFTSSVHVSFGSSCIRRIKLCIFLWVRMPCQLPMRSTFSCILYTHIQWRSPP